MSDHDLEQTGNVDTATADDAGRPQPPDGAGEPEGRFVGTADPKPYTRLSININAETEEVLKRHKENGTSLTETVRRAVILLDMLERESASGNRIQLVDRKGAVRELIMFL